MPYDNLSDKVTAINRAKAVGRLARKRNYARKNEQQLISDNGYTQLQAKAYLQAYDATVVTKAERAQIKDANPLKRKGENSPEVLAKRHAKNVSAQGDAQSPLSTNTASSQCENMCFHYSAILRRDTESSVDESLVNADAKNALSKVR